jgi:crotonobetainyl-CoA:carnitine CoA-transferase CaiB-like acyl-CoA transferase
VTLSDSSSVLPLRGLRVIDMSDSNGEMCGRYLADLGADVILVEPLSGAQSRSVPPLFGATSLYFATHNANKRSIALALDKEAGRDTLLELLDSAAIFIETSGPGGLEKNGLAPTMLRERNPQLVVLSISNFGQTGPYRDFEATNAVMMAIGGVLARSGIKNERPLLPPGDLAYETASVQAAWVALLAYWQALQTGCGDHLDFSLFEATAQVIDPGMGVTGSAAGGRSALELAPRGRPPVGQGYPIFACADGFVRICILNPRQWQGMCGWLGDDHEFTDPSYSNLGKRFKSIKLINALIAELFKTQKGSDLVAEGQKRGVPIAAVASPGQAITDPHFVARGTFVPVAMPDGNTGVMPRGYVEIDGRAAGVRQPAPTLGQHTQAVLAELEQLPARAPVAADFAAPIPRPFAGIRVLDLGVIVAGAELGRLLADQGAEVIKIESSSFVDGLRQGLANEAMTISFAQGSRGKQSVGLNLRSAGGLDVFKKLVAVTDIVISNFKPGTMESLGLGYDVLKAINPGIICAESSALGNTGPRSRSMGYGPLVRATAGLTWLWRYPEIEGSYSDSTTIVPDHFAARVSATAIAAMLIQRRSTGVGGQVGLAQAEAILTTLSTQLLRESLQPGSVKPLGNRYEFDAPNSVFPCAGDDEWCVVAIRNDRDWKNLCAAIGRADLAGAAQFATSAGRVAHRDELESIVTAWTQTQEREAVMETLQAVGVPAAKMQRLDEYTSNPHFNARKFFRTFEQPGLAAPMPTENGPVSFSRLPDPELRPAPFLAQHTEEVVARLLNMSATEIAELVAAGDLEVMPAEVRALLTGS